MELWVDVFLIFALGLLCVAYLFGKKSQERMASAVREFPNFIASKQFYDVGSFIAFDLQSRVIVYKKSVLEKLILINGEEIFNSGPHEPQIFTVNPDGSNKSVKYQLTFLTKTDGGIKCDVLFYSEEKAIKCFTAINEITEEKIDRKNKAKNEIFFTQALKLQITKNGRKEGPLTNGECDQYIDYLLLNIQKIVFRNRIHGDNKLITKAMFTCFGNEDQRWFRGKYTEGTLTHYVSKRKTALEI